MSQDNGGSAARGTGAFRISAENFDENYYLQQNPDVATAILFGEFASAYDHYVHHGWREQRAHRVNGNVPSNRVVLTGINPSTLEGGGAQPSSFIESLIVSRRGGIFLVGWIDDRVHRLERVELVSESWRATMDEKAIARVRRRDVEQALSFGGEHPFGFWSVLFADQSLPAAASIQLRLCLRGGLDITQEVIVRVVSDLELRETALGYLAQSQYFGNFFVETVKRLEPFVGSEIIRLNRAISHEIVAAPYVERFGSRRRYKGSIIVCLYGKAEYLPLQNCLFSGRPGIEDYEFIYVSNSPDISEQMFRDARTATRTYGLDQSLVILPGNAGFGAANNCAAALASSDRLLIVRAPPGGSAPPAPGH